MIIEFAGKKYKSVDPTGDMPCIECHLRRVCNCRELQEIKKRHGATTCYQLIGMQTFKIV